MTSRAFSCNKSLIRKNLSRFWLLSVWIGAVLLSRTTGILPLPSSGTGLTHGELYNSWTNLMVSFAQGFWEFLMSIIIAACVFSYLHKKRTNCFFHSLPMSRDGLFLGSFLSGLTIYALPMLLHMVITLPQILIYHSHCTLFLTAYLQAMAFRMLQFFLCYSMATFAMVLSGRVFFGVATALLLHFVFPATESLLRSILKPWLFGFNFSVAADPITVFLAPFFYLLNDILYSSFDLPWTAMGIYTAVALLLSGLTLLLHRKRQEENVGQSYVFPGVLSLLQYLLTLLLGYVLWLFFLLMIGGDPESSNVYPFLLWIIPAFFLIRMMLRRTRKVFQKKALLACGIYVLAFAAFLLSFRVDLLGIVRKVPKAEQVEKICVSIEDMDYVSTDPQTIEEIIALHREIIEKKEPLWEETGHGSYSNYKLELTYTMEGGRTLHRSYPIYPLDSKPASMAVRDSIHLFFRDRAVEQLRQLAENTETAEFRIGKNEWFTLSTHQKQLLFNALEQDIKNGMDPMIILNSRTNSTTYRLRLEQKNVYHSFYLPINATATRAFLDEIVK